MPICARDGCTTPAGKHTRGYCESDYRRRIRMGLHGWRNGDQARAHVHKLRDLGWTWEQIATEAGVSTWVPHRLGSGQTRNLLPETHDALIALPLIPRGSHRGVDSAGTRRRVQALAWMGWPCAEVARRAGTTQRTLSTLILPNRRPSFDMALRVAHVYDDLCMTTGPSKITAGKARAAGFLPPLAWDDDVIDIPDAELEAALSRRAQTMTDYEVNRANYALYHLGDDLPLTRAAAREARRRKSQTRRAA